MVQDNICTSTNTYMISMDELCHFAINMFIHVAVALNLTSRYTLLISQT